MKIRLEHIAKLVRVILLILIGYIVVNHAVIPHQHVSNICKTSENNQDTEASDENIPIVCHYYSDFVFHKVVTNTNTVLKHKQLVYSQVCSIGLDASTGIIFNPILVQNQSAFDFYNVNNTPTRGSPLFLV